MRLIHTHRRVRLAWLLAALAWAMTVPAAAEDACPKLKGMWLNLTPTDEGYLVPMSVAGHPYLFLLETEAGFAILDEKIVKEFQLPIKPLPHGMSISAAGARITQIATAPTIKVGVVARSDAEFAVRSHSDTWGPRASGIIGMNVLAGFDFELDLAHNKIGLFLPGHCPFTPYWAHDTVGSAPFTIEPTGTALLPMKLDGKDVTVSLETTSQRARMALADANVLFGIDEKTPNLIVSGKDKWGQDLYHYPFKTLSADEVTIANPDILLTGPIGSGCGSTNKYCHCYGLGNVQLGIKELRQLRFFFDFNEKKVYFTPAEKQS